MSFRPRDQRFFSKRALHHVPLFAVVMSCVLASSTSAQAAGRQIQQQAALTAAIDTFDSDSGEAPALETRLAGDSDAKKAAKKKAAKKKAAKKKAAKKKAAKKKAAKKKAAKKKAAKKKSTDEEEEEDGAVWGFIYAVNDYYPVVLDPNLEPDVEDSLILLWITSACFGQFCGPLWIPILIVGEVPELDYFIYEAVIAIIFEMMTNILGGATTAFFGIGGLIILSNLLYFTPLSIINNYDRAIKRKRANASEEQALRPADSPPTTLSAMAY